MKVGDKLLLDPEPSNKFDPNAVRIIYEPENLKKIPAIFIGYVPKKFSLEVSAMIGIGAPIICIVDEVNPDAKTYKMIKVTIQYEAVDEEESDEEDEGLEGEVSDR
jgi:hypothetical protein